ncbi:uncharacterized protein LOC111361000 [Spodoptera litura]|uniref:Uncharacterized protein LOC111361000 n=1 Tax=Spodoptera litura TaxID=69820 RepID=A0A9J7J1V9_SPOLT|nr:uncharacterized protein LOC111361000 [Spodoptera litura]
MKLYILVFLAVLSYISATTSKDEDKEQYVLATVLFYCNGIGDKIVAAGKIPKKVQIMIKYKLHQVYKNTHIKVAPIYRNYSDVPVMDDVYTEIRKKYTRGTVLFASIPEALSSRLVEYKSKLFKERGNVSGVEHFTKNHFENKKDVKDKAVESNVISTKDRNTKFVPFDLKSAVPLVTTYLPNTVYYTTQIKYRSNDKIIETLLSMLK